MDGGRRSHVDSTSSPGHVVVASCNIHGCVGADGRLEPRRIADVIQGMDVDVIGLQEVGGHTTGGKVVDQLEHLARALELTPVAGPTLMRDTGAYGNALLTRLPILGCRRIDLSVGRGEPRGAIDVDLDVQGRRLRVIATHLGLRWRERRKQRALLAETIEDDSGAVVVLGDLNQWWPLGCRGTSPWPGFAAGRCPRTYPSRLPLLSLDRIVARPVGIIAEIAAVRSRLAGRASDHHL
jgi:endonuclease/exonuclease/phosphatase family metal-dependent hydrolase